MKKAFIFDMNGTMINDMHYHTAAWHHVLEKLGAGLNEEQTKLQMYGKAEEMFDRIFGPGKFSDHELSELIMNKEKAYQEAFRPHLQLIKGLDQFLAKAAGQHIGLSIGTAAPKTNVDYVLDGLQIRRYFPVIIGAEDVQTSKPDPEVFLQCAAGLHAAPEDCVVFEDAPKGVEAAGKGGMQAVVLTTFHEAADFSGFDNVLFCVEDYTDPRLETLFQ